MSALEPDTAPGASAGIASHYAQAQKRFRKILDDITPFVHQRWAGTAILGLLYAVRAFTIGGWYIVTYALGIYLLNLFLAFLTPKFDPALEEGDEDEDGPALPTKQDDEFRPFIRRLPEFKFWFFSTRAFLIAFFCTLFDFFDLPVFWPILLGYFIILFAITMRRQIMHMIKYKYLPWDYGKKQYGANAAAKSAK
ncbi:hypothetical protein HK105_206579 [Polyrhizophydium stewartii]|uniref:Protein RER1 n=1 Tax=Polyrhizophydium stewartii TaxID=2732419 RepID=A0ABR4N2U9_9FUNG|nr:retention in endoplasmic reticulum protein 1 [Polyrhizophydium stewartii]